MKVVKDAEGNVRKFTINRKTWLRGNPCNSQLRNQKGSMCCLGHFSRACGVSANTLIGLGTPAVVLVYGHTLPKQIKENLIEVSHSPNIANNDICGDFVTANDKEGVPPKVRERKIKDLFLKLSPPVEVEFTN